MSEPSLQALVDAAGAYEALFVPALFAQWAPRVADAARLRRGESVLDVACGTGVLAREAAARTGTAGRVVGLDPNPGMRAVAGRIAPAVEWREGFAESLPFAEPTFDAVVSQFGLMFFRDRERALGEMMRVLRPGGRLAVAVWDSLERMPAFAREVELLEQHAGRAAADALRAPFVLGDRAELSALFERAGVTGAEITTLGGRARFPSIRTLVEADLRGWLPVMGIHLADDQIERILRASNDALAPWATSDGAAEFDLSAHIVTARAA